MATAAPQAKFKKIIHAYRRTPLMVPNGPNGQTIEQAVEVVFEGIKLVFKSNDAGHVVAECTHPAVFKRLVKEIPEAYIEYTGESKEFSNIVTGSDGQAKSKPAGTFVLQNGDEFAVLDDMGDAELRDFAEDAGLDAFPDALDGDDLRRAIFNALGGQQ